MKTFVACILVTLIASSNGFFFSLLGGNSHQQQGPQEYLHHHHHHHQVLHQTVPVVQEQHVAPVVNYVQKPIEVHPQYVHGQVGLVPHQIRIFKVIHETAPALEYAAHHGYAQPAVLTKVLQPIVNKNFIQSRHEHHYHQVHHGGPVGGVHHQRW